LSGKGDVDFLSKPNELVVGNFFIRHKEVFLNAKPRHPGDGVSCNPH